MSKLSVLLDLVFGDLLDFVLLQTALPLMPYFWPFPPHFISDFFYNNHYIALQKRLHPV
jgi:hypothetical protein